MSSASVRFFIITEGDEILRAPINKFERLLKGTDEDKIERFRPAQLRCLKFVKYHNRVLFHLF